MLYTVLTNSKVLILKIKALLSFFQQNGKKHGKGAASNEIALFHNIMGNTVEDFDIKAKKFQLTHHLI